ncbi:MAG TPA: NapC/NirT family cytochrome c [Acidobacteriaceae bacterium]|jgi:nitrate/TMAO reductase-like tetraheme cytochrome c subunit|nr:NapC/NirT family cytochrome c [Acidobacteriaceae bacterium]
MPLFHKLKENWLEPFFFYGNNLLSLIGGALTTASAAVLVGFWIVSFFGHGGTTNPYIGIVLDLALPGLFILGLVLIPIGISLRRRQLLAAGQVPSVYPQIDLRNPVFRRGIEIVVLATFINFVIVGTATYRGVSYMDSPNFCGQSCHVMAPQWAAYQESPHSHVDCVQCHVGSGMKSYVQAKVNGTKQLIEVSFHTWPTPIRASLNRLRPARETCEQCHSPTRFTGEKLLVKTTFADDEQNSVTRTVLVLHLGGVDSLSHRTGIHGHHLNNFEYVASDARLQNIIAVTATNPDGSKTEYVSSDWKGPVTGVRRTMDCIDCHNQATHVFQTAEDAVDEAMVDGTPSPSLPFVHKEALQLIQATYPSQAEAGQKIVAGLDEFYRSGYPQIWSAQRPAVDAAARRLVAMYDRNVFPSMKVTWGTYPNNIGHMAYPGCFRCHDGNHVSKDGKTLSNDCSLCHNLLAVDETHPQALNDLGLQNELHLQ